MPEKRLPVIACLRLPDGREYNYHTYCEEQYADIQAGWWTDGNGGCDCNRKLFLDREYDLGLDDEQCGDTIRLVSLTVDGKDQGVSEVA